MLAYSLLDLQNEDLIKLSLNRIIYYLAKVSTFILTVSVPISQVPIVAAELFCYCSDIA